MATKRLIAATALATLIGGCGGGEMSLTEYVDHLNALEAQASERADALAADSADIADFTPRHLQASLEQAVEIRIEVKEATDDIVPPSQVAELHDLIFDWHTRFMSVEQALAERAGTAEDTDADWTQLSESPEMAAYRTSMAEGKQICDDFQARLDATAGRGEFADTPWVPAEMAEVVEAVLGCRWFPEDPQTIYMWPPPEN